MATIAELLQDANRKIEHTDQIKKAMKTAINGSGNTVGDKFADYPPAVTNGRAGVAAAITEKGVQTSADAPFDVLEANVRKIEVKPSIQQVQLTVKTSNVDVTYYLNGVISTKKTTSYEDIISVDEDSIVIVDGKPIYFTLVTTEGVTIVAETTAYESREPKERTCALRCSKTGSVSF